MLCCSRVLLHWTSAVIISTCTARWYRALHLTKKLMSKLLAFLPFITRIHVYCSFFALRMSFSSFACTWWPSTLVLWVWTSRHFFRMLSLTWLLQARTIWCSILFMKLYLVWHGLKLLEAFCFRCVRSSRLSTASNSGRLPRCWQTWTTRSVVSVICDRACGTIEN